MNRSEQDRKHRELEEGLEEGPDPRFCGELTPENLADFAAAIGEDGALFARHLLVATQNVRIALAILTAAGMSVLGTIEDEVERKEMLAWWIGGWKGRHDA